MFLEMIRASSDLMHFFFVYDEYTDRMDYEGASAMADVVKSAFHAPYKPRDVNEHFIGEMARQLVIFSVLGFNRT